MRVIYIGTALRIRFEDADIAILATTHSLTMSSRFVMFLLAGLTPQDPFYQRHAQLC